VIRQYQPSDFAILRRIHADNGYGVDFNLLTFPHRLVLEENGKILGAILGRLSMQVDLILDRDGGNPRTAPIRWERLKELVRAGDEHCSALNVHHTHCFVPREIEKSYGQRLISIGSVQEVGACFLRDI
jgi:hypothetical protein